jgi:hypothetical protein
MSQEVSCLACQSRKASNRAVRDFIANGFLPTNFTGIVLSESDGFLFLIQTHNSRQVGLVGIEFGALPAVIDQLIGAYKAYLGQSIKGGAMGVPGNNLHNPDSGPEEGEEGDGQTGVTTSSEEG